MLLSLVTQTLQTVLQKSEVLLKQFFPHAILSEFALEILRSLKHAENFSTN